MIIVKNNVHHARQKFPSRLVKLLLTKLTLIKLLFLFSCSLLSFGALAQDFEDEITITDHLTSESSVE